MLDIDYGASGVIGDRAFSRQPEAIAAVAGALMQGLADGYFVIEGPDGMLLRDKNNNIRRFIARNAARKRISRERTGNFPSQR